MVGKEFCFRSGVLLSAFMNYEPSERQIRLARAAKDDKKSEPRPDRAHFKGEKNGLCRRVDLVKFIARPLVLK